MTLSQDFGKKFIITCELTPPRGPDTSTFTSHLQDLKEFQSRISGVNVVDMPGSKLIMGSLPAGIMVKESGFEPIIHITCRDRNMLALQADLMGASSFGIHNILALTGDHPACKSADHPNAKPVFDLDSTTLIDTLRGMNEGKDLAGKELNQATNFFIGAGLNPMVEPVKGEIYKTKRKLKAGAKFFQTQSLFEADSMRNFLQEYDSTFGEQIRDKILGGITPLHSYKMVKFLQTIPGLQVPEEVAQRMKNSSHPREEGINISLELIDSAREMDLAGIHLAPAGKEDILIDLLQKL